MLQRLYSKVSNFDDDIYEIPENQCRKKTKLEQDFDLGESLGKGGFGQIFKVKRKSDNIEFALKVIKFDSNLDGVENIRKEATTLSKLNHNNIVRYYNSWIEVSEVSHDDYEKYKKEFGESLTSEIEKLSLEGYMKTKDRFDVDNTDFEFSSDEESEYDSTSIYGDNDDDDDDDYEVSDEMVCFKPEIKQIQFLFIQMELCDKRNLRNAIDENLYLDDCKLTTYFKQICEGLAYIHLNKIVHRDLKPENIFFTSEGVIKIGDFGLAKQISLDKELEENDDLPYGSLTDRCGTSIYIAPEICLGNKFNIKADIYSLGVTYYEMCSQPLTCMEKIKLFDRKLQLWKQTKFRKDSKKKRILLLSLLHNNHHQRPTSQELLKILNSEKSVDELKNAIQQNKSVLKEEINFFQNVLDKSNSQKIEQTNFVLKKATEIFEAHGGVYLPLPIFIPSFNNYSDHLTTLINTDGNHISIANSSTIAFSFYVAKHNINKIRRYSIGKVFEEGQFTPVEYQDCAFQIVSPDVNDTIADAEILYIAKKLHDKVFINSENNMHIYINHFGIFKSVLRHCKIFGKNASALIEILIKRNSSITQFVANETFINLGLNGPILSFLKSMLEPHALQTAEDLLSRFKIQKRKLSKKNFIPLKNYIEQLKKLLDYAKRFKIDAEIKLIPLLINHRNSGNLIFEVVHEDKIIATGGRFDLIVSQCMGRLKRKKTAKFKSKITAVEISFYFENILGLMEITQTPNTNDVVIVSSDKVNAIPLYSELVAQNRKCEVVKEFIVLNKSNQGPKFVIYILSEYNCIIYETTERIYRIVFKGNWTETDLNTLLSQSV